MPLSRKPRKDAQAVYQVRLFRNGRNQAIRIPRELELPGTEATLRRAGNLLVIEARARPSLKTLMKQWKPLNIDWPEIPDPPPEPVRLFKP
jgi:antitoxin VapB